MAYLIAPRLSIKETPKNIWGYDTRTKKWLNLNRSLVSVLRLCDGKTSLEEIIDKISKDFGVSRKEAEGKIREQVRKLQQDGILEVQNKPNPKQIRFRRVDLDWPLQSVFVEVTRRCNLRCKHCYNYSDNTMEEGLGMKSLIDFVDKVDKMGVFAIYFTGGEPFVRKDFPEILDYVHSIGIETGILTNGTLLDRRKLDLLERVNPKFVAVSLDSLDTKAYEEVRGISNRRVIENVREMKKRGIRVRINMVLFKGINDSVKKVNQNLRRLQEMGFGKDDIAIDEFIQTGRGKNSPGYNIKTADTIAHLNECLKEVYGEDFSNKPAYNSDELERSSFCGVGESFFYLNSDGDMTLCTMLNSKRFSVGNIFSDDIRDVWLNSHLFRYFRDRKHIEESECKQCEYLAGCQGGCKAKSALLYGDFTHPDKWICGFFKS